MEVNTNVLKPPNKDCPCTEPKYIAPHILGGSKKWLGDQQKILSEYIAAATSTPKAEKKCVNGDTKTVATVKRDIATTDAEKFCSKQRDAKAVVSPIKGVYENYNKGTTNDVDFYVHWSLGCQQGKDVKVDYNLCKQYMTVVIDECDTNNPDGLKTGGTVTANCLIYGMKPNAVPKPPPNPPASPPAQSSNVLTCNTNQAVKSCAGGTLDVSKGKAYSTITDFCGKYKNQKLNPGDKDVDSNNKPSPPGGSPFVSPEMWYHITAGWQPLLSNGVPRCPNAYQIDIGHPTPNSDCESVLKKAFDQCKFLSFSLCADRQFSDNAQVTMAVLVAASMKVA